MDILSTTQRNVLNNVLQALEKSQELPKTLQSMLHWNVLRVVSDINSLDKLLNLIQVRTSEKIDDIWEMFSNGMFDKETAISKSKETIGIWARTSQLALQENISATTQSA